MLGFSQQKLAHSCPHLVQLTCLGTQVTKSSYALDKANPWIGPSGHKPTGKPVVTAYLESTTELGSTSKIITLNPSFYRSGVI